MRDIQKNNQVKYDWANKVILIAEDIYTSTRYYQAALKKTNSVILVAKNGQEAVEMVENNKDIDLVLMDIHMPELNGFEATRKIKKINHNIPIVMQTAYILSGEEDKSYEAGCDDFLTKPIQLNKLLSVVNNYL
ncbi:MAG: response regulator [Bacteroidales bacterium]|nr:response regulator [Bacteroidales bacterium]